MAHSEAALVTGHSYERAGLLLPKNDTVPIDAEVNELYETAKGIHPATYEQLAATKERLAQAEADFLASGCTMDVDLRVDPETIDLSEINERIMHLKDAKKELIADTTIRKDVKQAYRWAINERIANLYMITTSARGDMRQFARWNEFVYGQPDEYVYRGALDWICHDAETLEQDEDTAVAQAARDVLHRFGKERGYRELLVPDEKVFKAVRDDHFREGGYYDLLLDGTDLPREGIITSEIGDPHLQHVVSHNLHSDYRVMDAAGGTWSVAHDKEEVRRPKGHRHSYERYIGLGLGHEVGSHLLERVNGLLGPLRLAADGLDRYELGNEGRALIREQVPYETFDEFGKLLRWRDVMRRHIAVSLGAGTGDERPHRFSEVYQAINLIDTMYAVKVGKPESAHRRSWDLVTRVLKATDGQGGAYLKDKVYLEGNIACWLTAALRGPEAISNGDLSKSDINNPRHIALQQSVGLLPRI
ncbi:DUF1704 domain-containing protein [Candidatus Saccharibacteria bacterium]|nr:MAG: DUF1704 domain-containing protein [Candidatus Saccharibacteria bacterium]